METILLVSSLQRYRTMVSRMFYMEGSTKEKQCKLGLHGVGHPLQTITFSWIFTVKDNKNQYILVIGDYFTKCVEDYII